MTTGFSRWLDRFGDGVSALREAETGRVVLTYVYEYDEDVLLSWYLDGVKPKEAARRFMSGQARPTYRKG